MMHALYVLRYAKKHVLKWSDIEATLNSEKFKPVALAIIKLPLLEGIRLTGRQAVSQ